MCNMGAAIVGGMCDDVVKYGSFLPNRCRDIHLISTVTTLAAFALSYRSPEALAQVIAPHRWAQISAWGPLVGITSLVLAYAPPTYIVSAVLNAALGGLKDNPPESSSTSLYGRLRTPISTNLDTALNFGVFLGVVGQVAAICLVGASFMPYVQNKVQIWVVASVLTSLYFGAFLSVVGQVAAICLVGTSFMPCVQNKARVWVIASVLTAFFNTTVTARAIFAQVKEDSQTR